MVVHSFSWVRHEISRRRQSSPAGIANQCYVHDPWDRFELSSCCREARQRANTLGADATEDRVLVVAALVDSRFGLVVHPAWANVANVGSW